MISWLTSFLTGNSVTIATIAAAVLAVITAGWRMLANAKQAGIDKQKAVEANAREKNIEDIIRAGSAEHDSRMPDKNDRDNWR